MQSENVWTPSSEQMRDCNVARFMQRHAVASMPELVARSIEEPEWFWDAIVKDLDLRFSVPYERVLDVTNGPAWARWFVGGRLNLVESVLDRHALKTPDQIALIAENEAGDVTRWTYATLLDQTERAASALRMLGVGVGDRVGLLLPMIPQAVAAFLAVARIGAISVPIFSGFGAEAVAARLNDSEAVALITADAVTRKGARIPIKHTADEALRSCPSVQHLIVCKSQQAPVPWRDGFDLDWHELLANSRAPSACEIVDSEHPLMVAYTSGTTGKPKGAVHVHGGFLVKIAQEVAHQVDMAARDRLFWFTDLGWIMGPWEIVGGLASGGTIVLYDGAPETPGPDRVWSLVERHDVSILGVSPTLIRALMRHGEGPVDAHDLSRLRILASTGEPWNPDPWLWYFRVVGKERCPIINISGGTEVGACFLSAFPNMPLRPCSLGGPALGMAIDVVDPAGAPVRGAVGELVCRKPWPAMTRGLWNAPDRYLETYWSRFPDVWTHGDWASIDADGQWFLHGRSDDTLNVAGKRIGPTEIESVLVGDAAVSEAAAIGVPHTLKGEVVWCFVVASANTATGPTLASSLRARVADALGKSFAPERIEFVAELPRTRNAKILRRAIRAIALGQEPGDLSNLDNPASLEAIRRASATS